jgi:hypothetical protein
MGVQMFIDLYSWEGGYADGRRIWYGMLNRILQERDQKAGSSYSNDAITKSETEIASLEQQHLGADVANGHGRHSRQVRFGIS